MSKIELLNYLERVAKKYRKKCLISLKRNCHMSKYKGEKIEQSSIDAILVDFINFIGNDQGVDYGLCTHYLTDKKKKNDR